MKLKKLTLHNFKGVKDFEFNPKGHSATVYGANETGKTTLADALTWLLFDKDTSDRSPALFGIKTRENGEIVHGLNHEVEGVFDNITLRKVYKEKWTKKRGSVNEELTGHTTDYYVDGVPSKKKEYDEAVSDIMSEEQFKMLTLPNYFPEVMHWTDRREVLTAMAGEIDPEEIIAANPGLDRYKVVLGGRTEDQQVKVLKERKKKLNEELDNIPSRIDEVNRLIEDVDGVDEARAKVEGLKKQKRELEDKRSDIKSGGGISDLRVKLQDIEAEKRKLENDHQEKIDNSLASSRNRVNELQDKYDAVNADYRYARRAYQDLESKAEGIKASINQLDEKADSIKEREPELDSEPEVCPYCERPMDKEHDHSQYLEEFNAKKAEDLKTIKEKRSLKESELANLQEELKVATDKGLKVKARLNQVDEALEKAKADLQQQKDNQIVVVTTDAYKELVSKQKAIEQKIEDAANERRSQLEQLDQRIKSIDEKINESSQTIHQAEQNAKYRERMRELQEQRRNFASELEQVEEDLYVIEQFVRARSEFITEKVNELFDLVEWRLFKEQINGGIEETCDAVFKGVPFSEGLNNAGRIQAGIDIINSLSRYFSKTAPVMIDNAESVISLPETTLQVIRLVVSESHQKLEVEIEHQSELAKAI